MAFGRTGREEGCGRSNGGRGWLWMVAKKRCARVEAPSFPAGDLELVIKYKEPCFARSQLVLAVSLSRPSSPSCIPFRYARNTERAVFNSRLHSIYFESRIRRCRTWSKRPTDAISAIAGKRHRICHGTPISDGDHQILKVSVLRPLLSCYSFRNHRAITRS